MVWTPWTRRCTCLVVLAAVAGSFYVMAVDAFMQTADREESFGFTADAAWWRLLPTLAIPVISAGVGWLVYRRSGGDAASAAFTAGFVALLLCAVGVVWSAGAWII